MQVETNPETMPPQDHSGATPASLAKLSGEFIARLEKHQRILFKVAYIYCRGRDDRQDLVQEMLVQVWRSYARFDERVQFSTWMYRIAVNVAITHYRSESRRVSATVSLEEYGLDIAAADALFESESDNMRTLQQMISELDELNRALILLFLEGFSSQEIAEVVGISASNVSTRINRLKTKLQTQFNDSKEGKLA
jgi:RNA polymerase sigma factor (sigma-70 family)